MPTYEYECLPNGHRFEVKQSFADASLTACQVCSEPVRKVYSAAGLVFKGSGYYVNDSRKPAPSASNGSSSKDSDGGAKDGSATKDRSSTRDGSSTKEGGTEAKSGKESASKGGSQRADAKGSGGAKATDGKGSDTARSASRRRDPSPSGARKG